MTLPPGDSASGRKILAARLAVSRNLRDGGGHRVGMKPIVPSQLPTGVLNSGDSAHREVSVYLQEVPAP